MYAFTKAGRVQLFLCSYCTFLCRTSCIVKSSCVENKSLKKNGIGPLKVLLRSLLSVRAINRLLMKPWRQRRATRTQPSVEEQRVLYWVFTCVKILIHFLCDNYIQGFVKHATTRRSCFYSLP